MSRLAAICFLLLAAQSSLAQTQPAQLTPAEIFARVTTVYSSCQSYSDEGETSTTLGPKSGMAHHLTETFTTAFVRPDAFRFDFQGGSGRASMRFIGWKAGRVEKGYWFGNGMRQSYLNEILMNFVQVTHGSALTVPAMLMPDIFHGKGLLGSLTDAKVTKQEKIGGRRAFKIEARLENEPFKLWIDTNQFLILQVEQVAKVAKVDSHTTTRYRPILNHEIPTDRLAFNAPGIVDPNDTPVEVTVRSAPELKSNVRPRLKNFGNSAYRTSEELEKLRTQQARRSEDEDVVSVNTDMVVCDVLVVDQQGRPIEGLGPHDVIIKEDDQLQEIGSFSLGSSDQVPRSIVLVIDYSNSQLPYVVTSIEAAKKLVDKLQRRDRMAVVTDDVKLLVDFTSDKEALKQQLDALKERAMNGWLGRSLQYDALMATLTELFTREEERPIVIFQTDGDQLDALGKEPMPDLRPYLPAKKFSFEDLLTATEKSRATIYSIIPGVRMIGFSGQELIERSRRDWENRAKALNLLARLHNLPEGSVPPTDDFLLRNGARWTHLHLGVVQLAKASGGWADYLEKPEQADGLYAHVLNDINQRYIIAYYPKNRTRDGKQRKISFEVRGHPEYIIVGRRSYFAPLP
jgi:VWFA-related protein